MQIEEALGQFPRETLTRTPDSPLRSLLCHANKILQRRQLCHLIGNCLLHCWAVSFFLGFNLIPDRGSCRAYLYG